jgi:hypothetical protein
LDAAATKHSNKIVLGLINHSTSCCWVRSSLQHGNCFTGHLAEEKPSRKSFKLLLRTHMCCHGTACPCLLGEAFTPGMLLLGTTIRHNSNSCNHHYVFLHAGVTFVVLLLG